MLTVFKDLRNSGQQVAIIGHFLLQPDKIQTVEDVDNAREQSKVYNSKADDDEKANRYTTEHVLDDADGNFPASSVVLPADLFEIIAAWANLPDSVKAGILAMVKVVS